MLDLDGWFDGEPNAPFGWSAYLVFAINGVDESDHTHQEAGNSWEMILDNERDERLDNEDFLRGFAEGALAVYEQVQDAL